MNSICHCEEGFSPTTRAHARSASEQSRDFRLLEIATAATPPRNDN